VSALLALLAVIVLLGWSLRRGPSWWRVLCLLVLAIGIASASDGRPAWFARRNNGGTVWMVRRVQVVDQPGARTSSAVTSTVPKEVPVPCYQSTRTGRIRARGVPLYDLPCVPRESALCLVFIRECSRRTEASNQCG
jgi:hypothetical protein